MLSNKIFLDNYSDLLVSSPRRSKHNKVVFMLKICLLFVLFSKIYCSNYTFAAEFSSDFSNEKRTFICSLCSQPVYYPQQHYKEDGTIGCVEDVQYPCLKCHHPLTNPYEHYNESNSSWTCVKPKDVYFPCENCSELLTDAYAHYNKNYSSWNCQNKKAPLRNDNHYRCDNCGKEMNRPSDHTYDGAFGESYSCGKYIYDTEQNRAKVIKMRKNQDDHYAREGMTCSHCGKSVKNYDDHYHDLDQGGWYTCKSICEDLDEDTKRKLKYDEL